MPGIRNRVRGPSLIIDSQANGNNVELSTETENRTTESIVRNVISLRSKVFSRANSLDSCNAFPCLPKQAATPKVGSIFNVFFHRVNLFILSCPIWVVCLCLILRFVYRYHA